MKKISLVMLTLLMSCTGDVSEKSLDGDYVLFTDGECGPALTLDGDDYVIQLGCIFADGSVGIQMEVGTFEVVDDTIHFDPTRSTCADDDGKPFELGLRQDKDGITLFDDEAIMRFERADITPQNMSQASVFGCFDDDGLFTASPLKAIQ